MFAVSKRKDYCYINSAAILILLINKTLKLLIFTQHVTLTSSNNIDSIHVHLYHRKDAVKQKHEHSNDKNQSQIYDLT